MSSMRPWEKVLAVIVAALALGIGAILIYTFAFGEGHAKKGTAAKTGHERRIAHLQDELAEERKRAAQAQPEGTPTGLPPASAGGNGTAGQSSSGSGAKLAGSFAQLAAEVPGTIGVAYAPLGAGVAEQLGDLESGHAWSSFKVPITIALMQSQGGSLTPDQEGLAASAITASDNAAAASLFQDLEVATGGKASSTIEGMLAQVDGGVTHVSTAPPPPGAVSSWGQTEWPLTASTQFYGALACGEMGSADAVLSDMENVIPEQQWGLGQASFPAGTTVAYKAGWGPDGSESGPYLVRQAGIIRSRRGGAVVTIAAQDSSGSFDAGVTDLNRVADWVAEHVSLTGNC